MDLSVREVARILKVSETTVRGYIASGRLSAHRRGRQILVSQKDLKTFSGQPSEHTEARGDCPAPAAGDNSSPKGGRQPVLDRMSTLEKRVEHIAALLSENSRLSEELRKRDRELVSKEVEMEKLRLDLEFQKRLHEKEMEDQARIFQERWSLMEKETAEKIAREREHLESRLTQEKNLWSERLAQEKESFTQRLFEAHRQEGFWSRLMKMMTWS
ncbi:MAG: helix-turn-helix domain-containing protein [Syntrophobacteraceae bacterium]|nr:helix-turn-helix domain-containing protein [Syntrophobacteraceae bacterium]